MLSQKTEVDISIMKSDEDNYEKNKFVTGNVSYQLIPQCNLTLYKFDDIPSPFHYLQCFNSCIA